MKRVLATLLVLAGGVGVACYQDDVLRPAAFAPTRVLLTDDPFPFDSVSSVNIYVSRIEANSQFDTLSNVSWVELAAPQQTFDLLQLQQGATADLGQGVLQAGQYAAIRMTIDVDQSSIKYLDGSDAVIQWPSPGHGELTLYALVEEPLALGATGGEIVIDFDVGRSFGYRLFGNRDFVFQTWLRAVNTAITGGIEGSVTREDGGVSQPVRNANVTVYADDSFSPYVVATGHTDGTGHYKVAFLRAGNYFVAFEQPDIPALARVTQPTVAVIAGSITPVSAVLPLAGSGGAFLHLSGPSSVGVAGTIVLRAAVGDVNGDPLPNPTITWFSRDTAIAALLDSSSTDTLQFVLGRQQGGAWIVAQSGAVADSTFITVFTQSSGNPVATVTVFPPTLNLSIGDSTYLQAVVQDSAGNVLSNRPISWYPADSSGVVDLFLTVGPMGGIKAKRAGTTVIRATSDGKTGSATVTVQ